MQSNIIYILWDNSHIWGLMLWQCLKNMRVPCRLINAIQITNGELLSKSSNMLIVPGGTARLKFMSLGQKGCNAISDFIAKGNKYIGFCGGAGLGLSHKGGLGLCPLERSPYVERMQHLISGHIISSYTEHELAPHITDITSKNNEISLPVWWPGRFAMQDYKNIKVLASYIRPQEDLYLADIPLKSLPPHILNQWQDCYGVDMHTDFLYNQPCVITGDYGKGLYVLSYAHLETPYSTSANKWLEQLIRQLGHMDIATDYKNTWDIDNLGIKWSRKEQGYIILEDLYYGFKNIMNLGQEQGLLFKRTPWLYGWHTGIPGSALNNLYACINSVLSLEPNFKALQYLKKNELKLQQIVPIFLQGVESYLLAERLSATLMPLLPKSIERHILNTQRESLFGKPMQGGGLYKEILDILEEVIFLMDNE